MVPDVQAYWADAYAVFSMGGMKELAAMRRRQAQFFHEEFAQGAPRPGSDDGSGGEEAREPEPEPQEEEEVGARMISACALADADW